MRDNIGLFKGKRSPIGEWVYGGLLTWPDGTASICAQKPGDHDEKSMVDVMPDSLGEFTGRYDSTKFEELPKEEQAVFIYPLTGGKRNRSEWKGRPIFEGDICQFLNDDNETSDYEVFWRQGQVRRDYSIFIPWRFPKQRHSRRGGSSLGTTTMI